VKPTHHDNIPAYAEAKGLKWLFCEMVDHLWPWSKQGWRQHKVIQTTGLVLAVAVTIVWGLAINGQLSANAIIGWWVGWSVYEVIIRLQCKPYVKEGPWWGHQYKSASRMDMICYVLFKNLLIGGMFFFALRNLGLLQTVD
jgi:hypothetical protein